MKSTKHWVAAIVLAVALGITLYATRPAAQPEGLPDPATMRMEYRPGAFFPKELKLNGEVRLLTAPVVEMAARTRVRIRNGGVAAGPPVP